MKTDNDSSIEIYKEELEMSQNVSEESHTKPLECRTHLESFERNVEVENISPDRSSRYQQSEPHYDLYENIRKEMLHLQKEPMCTNDSFQTKAKEQQEIITQLESQLKDLQTNYKILERDYEIKEMEYQKVLVQLTSLQEKIEKRKLLETETDRFQEAQGNNYEQNVFEEND
jgi:hypothetical protein